MSQEMAELRNRILALLEVPMQSKEMPRLSSVLLALGDVWGRTLHRMTAERREAVASHALTLIFASMQELGMDPVKVAAFADLDAKKLRQQAQAATVDDDEPEGIN